MTKPLAGLNVLVTRPSHQQAPFIAALTELGAEHTALACIEIVPAQATTALIDELRAADQDDAILFTSTNAVHNAHQLRALPWARTLRYWAIGPATAKALQQLNIAEVYTPPAPYSSEALLRVMPIAPADLQKVAIITGQGGRNILLKGLEDKGIAARNIAVYQRRRPEPTVAAVSAIFLNSVPDIVTITSNEALQNLVAIVQSAGINLLETLLRLPLVVNSERCAALASQLGFENPAIVAPYPGDRGQLDAIRQWKRSASI